MAALVAAIGTETAPGLAWGAAAVAVASPVALVRVERRVREPRSVFAGVLSAVVNTFHELGAALGATAFSAVAAVSLVPGGPTHGFVRAFWVAAGVAAVAAVVGHVVTPPRTGRVAPGTTAPGGQRVGFH